MKSVRDVVRPGVSASRKERPKVPGMRDETGGGGGGGGTEVGGGGGDGGDAGDPPPPPPQAATARASSNVAPLRIRIWGLFVSAMKSPDIRYCCTLGPIPERRQYQG